MTQVNVLLVEDNDFTRSTVAAALRAEQCQLVASVASAREAMEAAKMYDIDCAVLDLDLGTGPSGIDLAYALRQDDPDLAIVILTTYADPRLHSDDERPLPTRAVYAVKEDVHSTGQLREQIDIACGLRRQDVAHSARQVPLTDAQVEVLRLVAEGCTNAEIARRRVVSERSVEAAIARILRRLAITPDESENSRVLLTGAYFALIGKAGGR